MRSTIGETGLIDAVTDPPSADVEALLGVNVRFRSPYADYTGRPDVAHLVGLIRNVLVDLRPVRRFREPSSAISVFEARVEGIEVQGTLFEQYDGAGAVIDAMLTVRPYAGLRTAMRAMQVLMEDSPLPSARSESDSGRS
jgi:hypothetical protein